MTASARSDQSGDFYASVPVFGSFAQLTDPGVYRPLPDDWVIGLTDIVRSTDAVAAGRYKMVNTAAAAVIVAIANRLQSQDFPFVFGGDGASFALPPECADVARETLAQVAAWVRDDFALDLRIALVTVEEIRRAGPDVRVARFAPSPDVTYAMFSGGGLAYAEAQMKAGHFSLPPGPEGARPDLNGLSCRFDPIEARRGVILSIIVTPGSAAPSADFEKVVEEVLRIAEREPQASRPDLDHLPQLHFRSDSYATEVKARGATSLFGRARVLAGILAAQAIFRFGLRVGSFDPARYRHQLAENTDFRKFDDGLRMTLDCTPEMADRLEGLLGTAERQGTVRFGTHRQTSALMTCFVPSPTRSDHIHFIDGGMGGYSAAARALKSKLA